MFIFQWRPACRSPPCAAVPLAQSLSPPPFFFAIRSTIAGSGSEGRKMLFATILLLGQVLAEFTPEAEHPPYRQPQLAALGQRVAVVYGGGDAIYVRTSTDGGGSFSGPFLVFKGGRMPLGMRRGPRVAWTKEALVVSAIVGEKGGGADGDLWAWRSTDDGRTWSRGVMVNNVPASAREGLHGMAAAADGLVFLVRLDLRSAGTKLYGAVSRDAGASWSQNRLVYASPSGSICECCHPTVMASDGGRIVVLFRNSLDGARDMYLAESRDGGEGFTAAKLGRGTWLLNACPMDGGDLKLDGDGRPLTVWRRDKELFLSTPHKPETFVATGRKVALAATRQGPVVVWSSSKGLEVRYPGSARAEVLDPEGAYANLATLGDGSVLAAWERGGGIVISKLR